MDLGSNQLSGPIPAELGNLKSLEVLTLFENQLSGRIPAELGNLPRLTVLGLFDNQLTGCVPAELRWWVVENDGRFDAGGLPICDWPEAN